MSTYFGAIADDLTGATDLAAMIARTGVPVSMRLGLPEAPPRRPAEVEVIALKCRSIPAAEAVATARAALDWLLEAGARRIYWKYCSTFDSTPQGNIGPVAEALMARLETEVTVHDPAFPENARTVYMGNLFVGRQLLAESPMKDHPVNPMHDSNLERLLAPQIGGVTGLIPFPVVAAGAGPVEAALFAAMVMGRPAHVVVDTVRPADLKIIAEAAADLKLVCGASALGGALAAEYVARGDLAPLEGDADVTAPEGGILAFSGGASPLIRAQAECYAKQAAVFRLDPARLGADPAILDEARRWLAAQPVDAPKLVMAGAAPEQSGAAIAGALGALAVAARDMGVRRFAVAGSDTAAAVTRGLGLTRLHVGPEIAPGVPWCFAGSGDQRLALALNAGNFGGDAFFEDAFARLR